MENEAGVDMVRRVLMAGFLLFILNQGKNTTFLQSLTKISKKFPQDIHYITQMIEYSSQFRRLFLSVLQQLIKKTKEYLLYSLTSSNSALNISFFRSKKPSKVFFPSIYSWILANPNKYESASFESESSVALKHLEIWLKEMLAKYFLISWIL